MLRRSVLSFSLAAGWLLHAAAAVALWRGWEPGLRSLWIVYMDLPLSLLWAEAPGPAVLAWSLTVGGAYWAVLTALFAHLVGRLSVRR